MKTLPKEIHVIQNDLQHSSVLERSPLSSDEDDSLEISGLISEQMNNNPTPR